MINTEYLIESSRTERFRLRTDDTVTQQVYYPVLEPDILRVGGNDPYEYQKVLPSKPTEVITPLFREEEFGETLHLLFPVFSLKGCYFSIDDEPYIFTVSPVLVKGNVKVIGESVFFRHN